MSAVSEVRVLPETIEETYRRVRKAWQETHPLKNI
jgi:hypothetical protein